MRLYNPSIDVTRDFDDREAVAYLRAGWQPVDTDQGVDLRHPVFHASTASDLTSEEGSSA